MKRETFHFYATACLKPRRPADCERLDSLCRQTELLPHDPTKIRHLPFLVEQRLHDRRDIGNKPDNRDQEVSKAEDPNQKLAQKWNLAENQPRDLEHQRHRQNHEPEINRLEGVKPDEPIVPIEEKENEPPNNGKNAGESRRYILRQTAASRWKHERRTKRGTRIWRGVGHSLEQSRFRTGSVNAPLNRDINNRQ